MLACFNHLIHILKHHVMQHIYNFCQLDVNIKNAIALALPPVTFVTLGIFLFLLSSKMFTSGLQ